MGLPHSSPKLIWGTCFYITLLSMVLPPKWMPTHPFPTYFGTILQYYLLQFIHGLYDNDILVEGSDVKSKQVLV